MWATLGESCTKNRQIDMATRKRSPSALSIDRLTAAGYLVGRVEQTIPHTRITRDLFGFVDLLAIREDEVLAVQVTSASNVAARVAKITGHENLRAVREAGIRIEVHGWRVKDGEDICRVVDLS